MRTPTSHENSANPRPFPQHLGDEKRRNRPHRDPEDTPAWLWLAIAAAILAAVALAGQVIA